MCFVQCRWFWSEFINAHKVLHKFTHTQVYFDAWDAFDAIAIAFIFRSDLVFFFISFYTLLNQNTMTMRALSKKSKKKTTTTTMKLSREYHTILNDPSKNVSITLTWNLNNRKCRLHMNCQTKNAMANTNLVHTSSHSSCVRFSVCTWNTKRSVFACFTTNVSSDSNRIYSSISWLHEGEKKEAKLLLWVYARAASRMWCTYMRFNFICCHSLSREVKFLNPYVLYPHA